MASTAASGIITTTPGDGTISSRSQFASRASFTTQHATTGLSFLVAMNRTTDYAEIYYEHNEGVNSQLNGGANSANWFAGVRVSP